MVRLILVALGIIPLTLFYWFLIFMIGRWKPYGNFNNFLMRSWAGFILKASGVKVRVENLEVVKENVPALILGNHQGNYDVAVLANVLPVTVRFLAKKELFRIPFFGSGMRGAGIIPVDRQNRTKAIESIEKAQQLIIQHKLGIVAFPEGTRSADGVIKPFKKGLFILAIKAQIPIIPFSISGTRFIMRKGQIKIYSGPVKLVFHEPIPTKGLTLEDRDELMEKVRQVIIEGYDHSYGDPNNVQ